MSDLYLGMMSGTSLDGIDAVLVDFADRPPQLIAAQHTPLPAALRKEILALNRPGGRDELNRCCLLDAQLGELFGDCALQLLRQAAVAPRRVQAIGCHGQTLRHQPSADKPYTVQVGDPHRIAERTGITTVADFRRRDMAAGGQGAPLMPAFHAAVFHHRRERRSVLNIGGMANLTGLPDDPRGHVVGFDSGPGNALLDAWCQLSLKKPFDRDGAWATEGQCDEALLAKLLKHPFFELAPPKSTGREEFNLEWLQKIIKRHKKRLLRKHVQATLLELSARTISDALKRWLADTELLIVCGGGVHNLALMYRLQALLDPVPLRSSEDFGVDPDWLEAMGFAWLACMALDQKSVNINSVTGARHNSPLGVIYPSRSVLAGRMQ